MSPHHKLVLTALMHRTHCSWQKYYSLFCLPNMFFVFWWFWMNHFPVWLIIDQKAVKKARYLWKTSVGLCKEKLWIKYLTWRIWSWVSGFEAAVLYPQAAAALQCFLQLQQHSEQHTEQHLCCSDGLSSCPSSQQWDIAVVWSTTTSPPEWPTQQLN